MPAESAEPLRVALLGTSHPPAAVGGLERFVAGLAEGLTSTGIDVVQVLVEGPLDAPLLARVMHYAGAARRAGRRADVVDAHFPLYAALPVISARRAGRPVVVHVHGLWAEEGRYAGDGRLVHALKTRIERSVHRRADELITLSDAVRADLIQRSGVHPGRVSVIPPGVDLHRFQPASSRAARRALNVDTEQPLVVTVRRLTRRTGVDLLVQAMGRRPLQHARLVVVGDGPDAPRLRNLVRDLALERRVALAGAVPDAALPGWYAAADVTALPSRALEGFGLAMLESLACGTPVVASAGDGPAEVLAGLDAGLLARAGDVDDLAAALARVLAGHAPTAAACRRTAERFDWPTACARTVAVYQRARAPRASRRLRVVYLDHTAQPGGGELAMARLISGLDAVDAHVILGAEGPLAGRLQAAGASVEIRPIGALGAIPRGAVARGRLRAHDVSRTAAYVAQLAARLRALRPDVVHTNSLKSAVYGVAAARIAGVPVVCHIRDRLAPDYLPADAIRLLRVVLTQAAAVVVDSDEVGRTLGRRAHAQVIPSPVDPAIQPTAGARRRNGALTIGMLGRLAPWKGQDVFLDAFATAFPLGPTRARVIGAALFGEREFAAELRGRAAGLGIADRVEFRGHRDDVAAELVELDVLVHCSQLPEPFGQVVLEGMAAGLPVVASDRGATRTIVTDGSDGLLVDTSDATAVAKALNRLAADDELRADLADRAPRTAAAYALDRIAPRIERVYREVRARR